MINWARVVELREEIGAEDFDEVVELFLCEVEERVEHLDSEEPLSEIEEDLHFLKGSALNLGFTSFANLCHEGEIKAQTGQIFSKLYRCYPKTRIFSWVMTRKLSDTWSRKAFHSFGMVSRKNFRIAFANRFCVG